MLKLNIYLKKFDQSEENFLSFTFHPILFEVIRSRYKPWLINCNTPLRLYNREVFSFFLEALSDDINNPNIGVIVVTGTSGIGKSYFQFFLLKYILAENYSSFILGYVEDKYYHLEKTREEISNKKIKYFFNLLKLISTIEENKLNKLLYFYTLL